MKKILTGILSMAMFVSALSACGGNSASSPTPTPTPKPTNQANASDATPAPADNSGSDKAEGGTVKMLTAVMGGKDEEEMLLFQDKMSELSGYNIVLEKPPTDYGNIMAQKLAGGELYDLVYQGADQYLSFIEQGILMDITEKVKASPVLSDPSVIAQSEWDDITIDGKIYAGFNKMEIQRVVALNKVHLANAGIDYKSIAPTLEGYYEVFKKLRENNPSKEYYPLDIVLSESYDLQPWFSSVGLKSGIVEADGKRTVPIATDEAAPVWEWLTKLYAEEILDPSCAVDKTKDMREKMGAEAISACVDWAAWVGLHNSNAAAAGKTTSDFEIASLPGIKGPNDYMLVKGGASLWSVPVNAPNVDGAIGVLEFLATQQGGELVSIGIEGHDYNIKDGKYELTEIGVAHGRDHGAPIPINQKFDFKAGLNLGVEEALSYLKYASIEKIDAKHNDFKGICGKWGVAIVKGEVSVAEGLESMRSELKAVGVID